MRVFKIELWKAFHNKGFLVACLMGVVIEVLNLGYNIWYVGYVTNGSLEGADIGAGFALFLRWVSADGYTLSYTLFLILFPLIAIMPFGWSFFSERKNGYQNQMLCRRNKVQYFTAKYAAIFLSGAGIIALILIVNLLLNAMVLPARAPEPDMISTVSAGEMFSMLYYTHPWSYCWIWIGISSLWGGMIASTSMLTAFIFKRNIYVLVVPFVLYQVLDYLAYISPVQYFLIAGNVTQKFWFVAASMAINFFLTYVLGLLIYCRKEVL